MNKNICDNLSLSKINKLIKFCIQPDFEENSDFVFFY